LYAGPDRVRLTYGALGMYDVARGGTEIIWYPGTHDCEDCARQCILGRVLALAIHLRGDLCLHASAVEVNGTALALVAPKGTGKSTLALALVAAGATLLTDDMLRIDLRAGARVSPGVQRLRLHPDSAAAATAVDIRFEHGNGGKRLSVGLRPRADAAASVPLRAVYLLQPVGSGARARRTRLDGARATMTLLRNTMLGPLLGPGQKGTLQHAVALARMVAVYSLDVPRTYDQLWSCAARLLEWHARDTGAVLEQHSACDAAQAVIGSEPRTAGRAEAQAVR
ncbi:MAG TPA: hypothetical protein VFU06_09275, partial [Longimicrobiales bacterium]|nr:hypothetical protein [Longimicrobiales bacterium]